MIWTLFKLNNDFVILQTLCALYLQEPPESYVHFPELCFLLVKLYWLSQLILIFQEIN